MNNTQFCSGCKRNRDISDFAPGPTDAAFHRTCKGCREKRVAQRIKNPPKTKRPRATTTSADTLGNEPGAESLNATSIRIEPIKSRPTYHPHMQETTSQKQRRRESDARSKKLRTRQRAIFKGDMVSPLTPSQDEREPIDFLCSVCQQTYGMDQLANITGDEEPICTTCASGLSSTEISDSDHPGQKICTRCKGLRSTELFEIENGISRTCRSCRIASHAARHRTQHSQPSNPVPLPPPQPHVPSVSLLDPAVSEQHWQYIRDFHEALDKIRMEECFRCEERWFGLNVKEGVCKQCRSNKNRPPGVYGPFTVFSAENNAHAGSVPSDLPPLNDIEEMLISRVHTHLQVRQVKGQQYKYAGHTVHFMKNMSRLYNTLPAHPDTLDIILLKPPSEGTDHNLRVNEEFTRAFTVRKSRVLKWLLHLIAHHPSYRDIVINEEVMRLLPENGTIHHLLPQRTVTPQMEESGFNLGPTGAAELDDMDPNEEDSHGPQYDAVVPDLREEIDELGRLRENFELETGENPPHELPSTAPPLSAPPFENAPVSEFDKKPLFSMAFPTLFPFGRGDINDNRSHNFSMEDWARHLMFLKDQRFARHARFRYVLFNTMMRQRVSREASWAIKQDNEITLDNLRQLLEDGEEQQIVGLVSRTGQKIKGTRPYWGRERLDLDAVVRNLGCPSIFITFSYADIQWPDLHAHMPGNENETTFLAYLTSPRRHIIATRNLVSNPHLAAHYLKLRFDAFFQHVIKKVFKIGNHWYRFEWQHRGSGHIHGFLWLEDGPIPTTVSEAARTELAAYWSEFITALNPDPTLPALGVNPAGLLFVDQINSKQHLTECINRFQKHSKCRPSYCLRLKRGTDGSDNQYCRFHYPKPPQDEAEVNNVENSKHYKFMAARNDNFLVPYNPTITLGWMANTDLSPCTNAASVLDYVGKYATKAEKKSESYKEIFRNVTRQVSDESKRPLLSAATKMLNALVVERDWPAQEVSHILLGLNLVDSSCSVTQLDLRPEEHIVMEIEDGEAKRKGKSWLAKYKDRMNYRLGDGVTRTQLQNVSLLEFCQWWEIGKVMDKIEKQKVVKVYKKKSSRAKARVLNIYPRYSSEGDKEEPEYENFCRINIMLHHPFVDENNLKESSDELSAPTFRYAYEKCQQNPTHDHSDPYTIIDAEGNEISDHGEPEEQEPDPGQEAWTEYARRVGNQDGVQRVQHTELGSRQLDRLYSWRESGDAICELKGIELNQGSFMQDARTHYVEVQQIVHSPDTLTHAQRVCFDTVINQYSRELQAENLESVPQLLMHVDGSAGTGKSHLIEMISAHLLKMAKDAGVSDGYGDSEHGHVLNPVVRGAPTGVAAFGIKGRTLHSLLYLPVRKPYDPLAPSWLMKLQTGIWKGCRFLIIDEKSMLGLKQLYQINARLRDIFPNCGEKYFGGLNVLLMGDFCQLPPVGEKALYNTIPGQSMELNTAQFLYRQFDKTVILTQIMRQQGEDEISRQFRGCLQELRDSRLSDASYDLLATRVMGRLSALEQEQFKDALRLYSTKEIVKAYNISKLRERKVPVIHIKSVHNNKDAALGTDDDAEGLVTEVFLSKGARLMLTSNILVEFGLVNGAMGTLLDIVWLPGEDPLEKMPYMLLFVPDIYTGPSLFTLESGKAVVPIIPLTREWTCKSTKRLCTRKAFPVVVAYAITVHKSQGLTLDKVVLDLTLRDHTPGLSYVAISRVRGIQGIMFDTIFTKARFVMSETEIQQLRVADKDRRALQALL